MLFRFFANLHTTTMSIAVLLAVLAVANVEGYHPRDAVGTLHVRWGGLFYGRDRGGHTHKVSPGRGGAVYVRWGHIECPARSSSLIYTGYVVGSHDKGGGPSDNLCLHKRPTLFKTSRPIRIDPRIWGSGYELEEPSGKAWSRDEKVIPCAVCESRFGENVLTIPGRDICPRGWTKEYGGIIMSGKPILTQHICADQSLMTYPGGKHVNNEQQLYPVTVKCGNLPCTHYKDKQILTCAVCTK